MALRAKSAFLPSIVVADATRRAIFCTGGGARRAKVLTGTVIGFPTRQKALPRVEGKQVKFLGVAVGRPPRRSPPSFRRVHPSCLRFAVHDLSGDGSLGGRGALGRRRAGRRGGSRCAGGARAGSDSSGSFKECGGCK